MKSEVRSQFKLIAILSVIAAIIALLFSWMGFSEYMEEAVFGHAGSYPFGSVNEVPWYYGNSSIYRNYNLFSGVFFLIGLIFTIIGQVRKRISFSIAGITLIICLFIAQLMSSGVQS